MFAVAADTSPPYDEDDDVRKRAQAVNRRRVENTAALARYAWKIAARDARGDGPRNEGEI